MDYQSSVIMEQIQYAREQGLSLDAIALEIALALTEAELKLLIERLQTN